uniref:Gamma-glutamyltransferase 5 n=1 Tax=Podarcis muralis TaxID=64176 RepID=A0A670JSJ0_PODMU
PLRGEALRPPPHFWSMALVDSSVGGRRLEREPLWGSCKMTRPICFKVGPRWIAVPGELRGYEEAHRRYGKLPWKTLFEPTIKFLDPGIRIPEVLGRFLSHPFIQPHLNKTSLRYKKPGAALGGGDLLRWPALVETLRAVAEKGANEFYRGTTAEKLVQDIAKEGSTLSLRDLRDYRVEVMSPVNISLGEYTVYSAPRPAAGPILLFILNVLKGFNFTKESMSTPSQNAETYHYIAETLKFANGQRVKLDDPLFSRTGEGVLSELISDSFASQVRQRIDERGDHPASHYDAVQVGKTSFGTSHVSVLAEDGSAVSATSTINYPFGSMVYSPQTGIILNNELSDFCMKKSSDRISPGCSPSHSLVPPPIGEMPPSSMTPSILISRDGQSKLVVGGSGGQLIIPAVALHSYLFPSHLKGGCSTGRAPLPRRPSVWFPVTSLLAMREPPEGPRRWISVSGLNDGGGDAPSGILDRGRLGL